jgi:hypothetical protein
MAKKFYIKERHNPQLDNPYYVPLGQITQKDAKRHESSAYGWNNVIAYQTEEEYKKALERFKADGCRVI